MYSKTSININYTNDCNSIRDLILFSHILPEGLLYILCNGTPVCSAIICQISYNHLPNYTTDHCEHCAFPCPLQKTTNNRTFYLFSPLYTVHKIQQPVFKIIYRLKNKSYCFQVKLFLGLVLEENWVCISWALQDALIMPWQSECNYKVGMLQLQQFFFYSVWAVTVKHVGTLRWR